MPSDAPLLISVPNYSRSTAYEFYPGQRGQDDQQDAMRHILAAGTLARKYGPEWAERLGRWHEYKTSPLAALKSAFGVGEMPSDYAQDVHNNALGVALAQRAKSQEELETLAAQLVEKAQTQKTEGVPWVNKAEGGLVEPPLPAAEFSPLEMDYIIGNVTSGQHEPAYAEGGSVESTHIPYDEAKISSLVNALREELHA